MSLTRRVVVAAALGGVALLAAGLVTGATAVQLTDAQRLQHGVIAPARQSTTRLLSAFVDQESGMRGYLLSGQEAFLAPYRQAAPVIPELTARLRVLLADVPGPSRELAFQQLTEVESAYRDWGRYADERIVQVRTGARDEAVSVTATGTGKARFDALRVQAGALEATLDAADRLRSLQSRLVVVLVAVMLLTVGLFVAAVRGLMVGVVEPIQRLATATRLVTQGNLSVALPVSGVAEIAVLSADVETMRDRLLADTRTAERALHALEQHSPAIAALREALTPHHDAGVEGLRVAGRIDPAEGVLAGDWYDAVAVTPHRLALVLGDVSGHGPRSAVLALRLKNALVAALRAGATPGQALAATGRTLTDVPDELFATVLIASIDVRTRRLTYANAGHPAGLLLASAGSAPGATTFTSSTGRTLRWWDLPSTGPLLSPVVSGWSWADAERPFDVGDTLIAFTDGVLEARDRDGEQFGLARVFETLARHDLADGARLLDALAAAVIRHTRTGGADDAGQRTATAVATTRHADDRTLVSVHHRP